MPLKFGTKYPENLTNTDKLTDIGANAEEVAKVEKLLSEGYDKTNPKDYCEQAWRVQRYRLIGNPVNVEKLGSGLCHLTNELPVNLDKLELSGHHPATVSVIGSAILDGVFEVEECTHLVAVVGAVDQDGSTLQQVTVAFEDEIDGGVERIN